MDYWPFALARLLGWHAWDPRRKLEKELATCYEGSEQPTVTHSNVARAGSVGEGPCA